jgi:UDP-sulfoquinovose synthase
MTDRVKKANAARALLREIANRGGEPSLSCGLGPESLILIDMIAKEELNIEPFCLDTLRLPPETYRLAQVVEGRYNIQIRMIRPDSTELDAWVAAHGFNAFYRSVALRRHCCALRKGLPLKRYLRGKTAWITGLRRAQSRSRAAIERIEWDTEHGIYKFNPLVDWTDNEIWNYIQRYGLPYNPLHDRGYASIGCAPCTRAVKPGEDRRAGRWWWETDSQKECGIHVAQSERSAAESRDSAAFVNLQSRRNGNVRSKTMRVLVLGGDGFCGWPTALHLSAQGHEVAIVDNLSRRKIDIELECESLTPIRPMSERLSAWKEVSGKTIEFHRFNVARNYQRLLDLLNGWHPDAVVHFAEQRAAPYSMKSSWHKRYTVDNNINATNNLLAAIVESGQNIHVAHLGTMGVYGYGTAGMKIPEGYLRVQIETDDGSLAEQEILYPVNPGSIYHMTKTQDQLLFFYYNKNDRVRITDLHQGIVWGTQTSDTKLDDRLINRFDYDGDYGTVLNRFLMQGAAGYPLTVHGTGGQTRAFIHIQDTVKCIQLALENPPESGARVRILNQMTECHRVRELARMISERTNAEIAHLGNPRNEADENDLYVSNDTFIGMGLDPITLSAGLMNEVSSVAQKYMARCDRTKVKCVSIWNAERRRELACGSSASDDESTQVNSPAGARKLSMQGQRITDG